MAIEPDNDLPIGLTLLVVFIGIAVASILFWAYGLLQFIRWVIP